MMFQDSKLPGRTRVQDVVINGKLINRVLAIDAKESKACALLWATGAYTQLHIGSYENPGINNIEFLDCFENVTKVHVMLPGVKIDLSPLNKHAHTLTEYMCNDGVNALIDCDRFFLLQSISQPWSSQIKFDDHKPSLRRMFFEGYRAKEKNLGELPDAPNLRELGLLRSDIRDLSGIHKYPRLEKIFVTGARGLTSVADLSGCRDLNEIELDGCKQVHDLLETLDGCGGLEKLVLMKVSDLGNIQFIERMPNLKWLNMMDTNVIDGDMSFLLRHPSLEYAVFASKKHFSHTEAQVRSVLQAKKNG